MNLQSSLQGFKNNFKDEIAKRALDFSAKPKLINPIWKLNDDELKTLEIIYPTKYEWDGAGNWTEWMLYEFRQRGVKIVFRDLPQPYRGIVMIQAAKKGLVSDVVIDYSDYPEINDIAAANSPLYFKMQFSRNGYERENVIAGGYVSDNWRLYWNLQNLRKMRDSKNFKFEVHGRFGLANAKQERRKAIEILKNQQNFSFFGGFQIVKYADYLREISQSKIVIDLPGEGDLCWRLVNYLAIGACVVAFPHRTRLHADLTHGENIVFVKEDFSNLAEICEFYLENEAKREALVKSSRKFFDENLHQYNLANYYLKNLLDHSPR